MDSVGNELDPAALLAAYDEQLRTWLPPALPAGTVVEQDGPVLRLSEPGQRGFVAYRSVADLPGDQLDALIARQRDLFAARGLAVEWKLHGHDQPTDLSERLVAAGFVPEERETVVIGLAAPLAAARELPPGVRLREVTSTDDLARIVAMEEAVWHDDRSHLLTGLAGEIAADPTALTIVVAERESAERDSAGPVLAAGWIRYVAPTKFATLWGGSTLPEARHQGIYSALVSYRAALALARGYSYLQVDASEDSRPILERSGFVAVTTTTPYVHEPVGAAS